MEWLGKYLVFLVTQVDSHSPYYFLRHPGEGRIRVALVRLGWQARFYQLFHCCAFVRVEVGFPRIKESKGLAAVE
ncbi:hypothetical protein Hanom_Chr15g01356811 [Helianthus anomalus]